LTNIPASCNYNVDILNYSQTVLLSTTNQSGTSKSITSPLASGNYYIRVYSSSGFSTTSNYWLALTQRSQTTTVSGYINPTIKPTGGASVTATGIPYLPVKIIYTYGTSNNEGTITTTTTNSSGSFSATFSVPTNAKKVYVQIYPSDSKLTMQLQDGTIPTSLYEIPLKTSSVSLSITSWTDQMRASLSIWRHAKNGLAAYASASSRSTPSLVFRCTAGTSANTAYYASTTRYISIDGTSSAQDYYDYDIILHEMGHWNMSINAGIPLHIISDHNWANPSTLVLGYSEGWAHYFSAAIRGSSYVRDYNSSGQFFGGNLSNCTVAPGYGSSFTSLPMASVYEDNIKYEAKVGSSLWNLNSQLKTFYELETVMSSGNNNYKEYYQRLINTLSTSANKEAAWNTCNTYGCAFDMTLPSVNLNISNLVASMSATDDIAVKQYEWYINGIKYGSTHTGSTGSLDLNALGLNAGTHTLECRVYDPEGIAPGARPRTTRYGSETKSFVIAAPSASRVQPEDPAVSSVRIPLEDRISDSTADIEIKVAEGRSLLELGMQKDYNVTVNSGEELLIYADITGAVKAINIYSPNGALYDALDYISPDAPYAITKPMEGVWKISIENYSAAELASLIQEQEQSVASAANLEELPATDYELAIGTILASVDLEVLEIPEFTSNPYILQDIMKTNTDIRVFEGTKELDVNEPLAEGAHSLVLVRVVNAQKSEPVSIEVTVDQTAPDVTIHELETTVSADRVVLSIECSDDTAEILINGERYDFGTCGSRQIVNYWLLDMGENVFTVEAKDLAGNVTTESIVVTRT